MDYELAKELKDAGFPYEWPPDEFNTGENFFPTLEELIEACRPDFRNLYLEEGIFWATSQRPLRASPHGATPSEAVARLFIALNKK